MAVLRALDACNWVVGPDCRADTLAAKSGATNKVIPAINEILVFYSDADLRTQLMCARKLTRQEKAARKLELVMCEISEGEALLAKLEGYPEAERAKMRLSISKIKVIVD